jgi:PKD repeat protein
MRYPRLLANWKTLALALTLTLFGLALPRASLAAPPSNDTFANATTIAALPFNDTQDPSEATVELGEPLPACYYFGPPTGTIWYAFTPSTSETITASSPTFASTVNVYSGTSLASLSSLGCANFNAGISLRVTAGQTYYFQVGVGGIFGTPSVLTFSLIVTPPPQASFFFYPQDPSTFDTITFVDISQDPGNLGFQSYSWSFGDGATASDRSPTHRYASDGDYTVKDTVTTTDGRTNTATQVVRVRTHDVAIVKFVVPQSASAGQTRQLTVSIADSRYPETVQVQLLKSSTGGYGGFQEVGSLTQSVPVTQGNHTTPFSFNYTFTSDDAAAGKVTFEAVASIQSARDALPGDNTVISLPTVVH